MRQHLLPTILCGLAQLIGGVALLGSLLNIPMLYQWGPTIGMAPNTAAAILAIATAGLCHLCDHSPPYDASHDDD